jgi:hypothetical protein
LFVAGKVSVSPLTVAGPIWPSSQFVSVDTLKSARKYETPLTGVDGSVMLKLGEVFHVTVAEGVNEKYQAGVLPLCGRRALLDKTGRPDGPPVCEPTVTDDPPPVTAAGTVTLPLNPPEAGSTRVAPLAGIVRVHGLPMHVVGGGGPTSGVLLQPAITKAATAVRRNSTRNDAMLLKAAVARAAVAMTDRMRSTCARRRMGGDNVDRRMTYLTKLKMLSPPTIALSPRPQYGGAPYSGRAEPK